MKVRNMTSAQGNEIANQFVIMDGDGLGNYTRVFQSYDSVIVRISGEAGFENVELDADKWDYSKTTGKYRNQFLGETKRETQAKIDSGEYILADLN